MTTNNLHVIYRCEPDVPGWVLCNKCTLLPVSVVDAVSAGRCSPGCAPAPFDTCNTQDSDENVCPPGASKVQCTLLAAGVGDAPTTYTIDAPVFGAIASNLTSCTPNNATHHECSCYLLRNDVLRAIAGNACVPACCRYGVLHPTCSKGPPPPCIHVREFTTTLVLHRSTELECGGQPVNIIDERATPNPPPPPLPTPLPSPMAYYSAVGGGYYAYSPVMSPVVEGPPTARSPVSLPLPQWGSASPARGAVDALQPPSRSGPPSRLPSPLLPLPNPGSVGASPSVSPGAAPAPPPTQPPRMLSPMQATALPTSTVFLSPPAYAPAVTYAPVTYTPYAPAVSYVPYSPYAVGYSSAGPWLPLPRSPAAGVQGPNNFGQCPTSLQQYVCRAGGSVQVLDEDVASRAFVGVCRLVRRGFNNGPKAPCRNYPYQDEHAARMVCGHTALDLQAYAALLAGACSRVCLRPYPRCFPGDVVEAPAEPPVQRLPLLSPAAAPKTGPNASTSDMVPGAAPVVQGMTSPSPTPTVCLLQVRWLEVVGDERDGLVLTHRPHT